MYKNQITFILTYFVIECLVNTHWNANGHNHYGTHITLPGVKLRDHWHVYEMEWNANYVIGRFDGIEYYRLDISHSDEFKMLQRGDPMFLILNMAVGGRWPGSPDSSSVFPQEYRIDWVRAYTKSIDTNSVGRKLQSSVLTQSIPANSTLLQPIPHTSAKQPEQPISYTAPSDPVSQQRTDKLLSIYPTLSNHDLYKFNQFLQSNSNARDRWKNEWQDAGVLQTLMAKSNSYHSSVWTKMKYSLGIQ